MQLALLASTGLGEFQHREAVLPNRRGYGSSLPIGRLHPETGQIGFLRVQACRRRAAESRAWSIEAAVVAGRLGAACGSRANSQGLRGVGLRTKRVLLRQMQLGLLGGGS
ncbi:MAG TPA: hypothetical protein VFB50_02620 [Chloroflexota bacterium]|nr:hypothetical protein [Chloroflexota bacterium]